ncbi:hypothetical protein CANINC_000137 [Pichia inconspicua]|uniref:Very long-chain fatty acid transport protein n=1 Tax=Pichia inconspicua TaxID=52247 RepID=A0A4T0X6X2_9ASCO|nr:hypothetical protein CANINC_000137 [[Candida] inconspicua]
MILKLITVLLLIIGTITFVHKFKHPVFLYKPWKKFNDKYRVVEDLYLVPLLFDFFQHYVIQCRITKRFSIWYEFEKIAHKSSRKVALKYPRQVKDFKQFGDDAFIIDSFTYGELYECILKMSHILKFKYNVNKGDVVTLYFMNKPLFIILWLSLWNLGATPAFINYNLTSNPLIHCIKVVDSKILFVDDECLTNFNKTRDLIKTELSHLEIVDINEIDTMNLIKSNDSPMFRQSDKLRDTGSNFYDPAILLYTSGTTGLPKSAVNSWRKMFMAAHLFPHAMHIDKNSNIYTAMPLYHGTASILGVVPALMKGATISIGHKFSLSSYWTQVKLCQCNTIQYVGEVCRYLVDSDELINERECYGKIKLAYGNGLRPDIWMKLKERFGIFAIGEFYSSSEAPFATTCYEFNGIGIGALRNNGYLADKFLSLQYQLVKMDPDDETSIYRNPKNGLCEVPGVNEKGEMLMRILNPKNVKATFPGYINDDNATYSKIIKDVFRKGDAWVRSDDLMRKDELGCIHFVDRMGDTYRWKSENVSTTEVENELLSYIPELKNCVVVGARVENHEGRAGYALMQTINNNNELKDNVKLQKLLDKIALVSYTHLPHFARPVFVTFENIELTENHKISKKLFRDPVLPAGKNGTLKVYYLNGKSRTYELLDNATYEQIKEGSLRL